MISKNKYFLFVAAMLIIVTYLPFAQIYLPPYVRSYHFWAAAWGASLLFFKPLVLKQKIMLWVGGLGCYLLIMYYYFYQISTVGDRLTDLNYNIWQDYYSLAVAVSIISYFNVINDYVGLAKLSKLAIFLIGITAIMTIILSFTSPLYSRINPDYNIDYTNYSKVVQQFGAGLREDGFGFVYLIPLLFFYLKNNPFVLKGKKWIIILLFIYFIAIIRMQFTTFLLFAIFLIIFSLVSARNRIKTLLIVSIVVVIIIFVPNQIFVGLLNEISNLFIHFNQQDYSLKFSDMASFISMRGENIAGNVVSGTINERYIISFNEFWESPLFGCYFQRRTYYGSIIGEHHVFWIYKLVVLGLVGTIIYLKIFILHIKNQYAKITNTEYKYFFVLALSILLYGFFKVIMVRQAWMLFFVIISGMYYLPLLKIKK